MREFLIDSVTGFLCPADSPAELAEALQRAAHCASDWPRIRAQASKRISEQFHLEQNLIKFRRIVEQSAKEYGV